MKQNISNAERVLSAIGDCTCTVTEVIEDPRNEGSLVLFDAGSDEDTPYPCSAYVYNSGEVFTLYDWHGFIPTTLDEIPDAEWLTPAGRRAVVLNGSPRIFLTE